MDLETVEKSVGQIAIEGVAKQLLARGDAPNMDEAISLAFQQRPDLYELYRNEPMARLATKRAVPGLGKTSAHTKLEAIARGYMNSGDPEAPTFSLALEKAIRENPTLYQQHVAEMQRGIVVGTPGIIPGS